MVGQEIERVELFTPLGICFCIFKIIQSPLILVLAITLTFVWLYFLIKYAKDVNLSVFMPLFTIPLILTFAEQVLVILLAADLAKSLISIINLVSR